MILSKEQQKEELSQITLDMRALYDNFVAGALKREDADTGANVAGKNLKALQILLAHDLRDDGLLQFNSKLEMAREKQLPSPTSKKRGNGEA